mgnify:CR=1 FL=1
MKITKRPSLSHPGIATLRTVVTDPSVEQPPVPDDATTENAPSTPNERLFFHDSSGMVVQYRCLDVGDSFVRPFSSLPLSPPKMCIMTSG